jgi:DUF4097 and DUF4098 domain-containing protein YvlB
MSWKALAFLSFLCAVSVAQAQEQVQRFKNIQSVRVMATSVNITVEGVSTAQETLLKVSGSVTSRVEEGVLHLEPSPGAEVHIKGPSTPLVISTERGQVKLLRWARSAHVMGGNLNVNAQETSGEIWLQTHEGTIQFARHDGPLDIDTYRGRVMLSKIEGDVKLTNFIGDSQVEDLKGQLALDSYSGKVNIDRSEGHLLMRGARAPIRIAGYKGSIEGKVQEGALTIELAEAEPSIKVESTSGPLQVRVPASVGAQVYVSSDQGTVNVPAGITTQTTARGRVGWGRIMGTPGGRIHLKSESGDIRIR